MPSSGNSYRFLPFWLPKVLTWSMAAAVQSVTVVSPDQLALQDRLALLCQGPLVTRVQQIFYMALLSSSVLHFVPIIGLIPSQVERSALALVKFNMIGDCPALIYPDICPSVIFKLMFFPSIYHNSNGTESVQWQMTIAVGEYSVQYLEVPGSTFRNLSVLGEALEAGCSWFIVEDLALRVHRWKLQSFSQNWDTGIVNFFIFLWRESLMWCLFSFHIFHFLLKHLM